MEDIKSELIRVGFVKTKGTPESYFFPNGEVELWVEFGESEWKVLVAPFMSPGDWVHFPGVRDAHSLWNLMELLFPGFEPWPEI